MWDRLSGLVMAKTTNLSSRQSELLLEALANRSHTLFDLLYEIHNDAVEGSSGSQMETRLLAAAQLAEGIGMLADSGVKFNCRGSLQAWAVGPVWDDPEQAV